MGVDATSFTSPKQCNQLSNNHKETKRRKKKQPKANIKITK
jgi:hypothetical protein